MNTELVNTENVELKIGVKSRCQVLFKGDPIGNIIMGRNYQVIYPGGQREKVETLAEALERLKGRTL